MIPTRCDACRHAPVCKGCAFRALAENLDTETTRAMLAQYCNAPGGAAQCVRLLTLRHHDLALPPDIMPDGRSCFDD